MIVMVNIFPIETDEYLRGRMESNRYVRVGTEAHMGS